MFKNLKVRHKLLGGLAVVGLAFLTVLSLLLVAGLESGRLLGRIEDGEVPALNMRRDLEATLTEFQRSLQDAAATQDLDLLEASDRHRATFFSLVEGGESNPVLDPEVLARLAAEFDEYSVLAQKTTRGLIERGPDQQIVADLATMTSSYSSIKGQLAEATTRQSEDLRQAFADARRRQLGLAAAGAVFLVAVLALLLALAMALIRQLDRSLGQAASAAEALAHGDVTASIEVDTQDEIGRMLSSMKRMMSYLRDMANAADALARGDFTGRVDSRSERDVFGRAFREMSTNLGRMIGRIADASQRVLSSTAQISAAASGIAEGAEGQSIATEETSTTMVEIASQIESVSRSMIALAGSVEETASSMQEIAASTEQSARSADDFLASVEEMTTTIEEMAFSIKSIAAKVNRADQETREGAAVVQEDGAELSYLMRKIGESSQDIGKIVEINREIAKRTRLLAINAAIEASQSGEMGKGIGVIATEVKKLSEQAAESTQEIASYVATVQDNTGSALAVTETILERILGTVTKSTDMVRDVNVATQEHDKSASEILETAAHMRDTTRQLAVGAREQASGAGQVLEAVLEMERMTLSVAQASEEQKRGGDSVVQAVEQIARIAREHLSAAEDLSSSTQELAREARALKEMSEQFDLSPAAADVRADTPDQKAAGVAADAPA